MNTPGHMILSLAVLGRKEKSNLHLPIVLGALAPDVPIYLFYLYQKFVVVMPEIFIWGVAYYMPEWQRIFDSVHSFPILLLAYFGASRLGNKWLELFFTSMILHSALDFPVHNSDAHGHFFPLTNFRFESPISYWDPHHFGVIGAGGEIVLVILASIYILRWNKKRWVKKLVYAVNLFYIVGTALMVLWLNEYI